LHERLLTLTFLFFRFDFLSAFVLLVELQLLLKFLLEFGVVAGSESLLGERSPAALVKLGPEVSEGEVFDV